MASRGHRNRMLLSILTICTGLPPAAKTDPGHDVNTGETRYRDWQHDFHWLTKVTFFDIFKESQTEPGIQRAFYITSSILMHKISEAVKDPGLHCKHLGNLSWSWRHDCNLSKRPKRSIRTHVWRYSNRCFSFV